MSISLTTRQEQFIQTKLQAGKYNSAQEIIRKRGKNPALQGGFLGANVS